MFECVTCMYDCSPHMRVVSLERPESRSICESQGCWELNRVLRKEEQPGVLLRAESSLQPPIVCFLKVALAFEKNNYGKASSDLDNRNESPG